MKEITIKRKYLGIEFTFNWRSSKQYMGRFGGGWNWEVGCQASRRTIILNLLVCSLRIHRPKKKENSNHGN